MGSAMRRLRIAQVAPPVERVPPAAYGGTERVVDELTHQLVDRGHDVTVFASGDSDVPGRLVPTVERALRPAGIESDASGWFATTVKMVIEQAADFDVIHSHLEWWSIPLARLSPVPAVATFHGRLDLPWADRLLGDAPDGMVAISRHQASTHPDVPWTIIHNGLTLDRAPFNEQPGDAFCFVGRVDAEKGLIEAIDIALRAGRRLRIAAKVGNLPRQREYYESVFRPALQRAGRSVEYLGELQPDERDQLFADSYATLMPGAWPEPFGLVSIESLACGTPVLARRVGALPEIIREGVDGFFGDDAVAMAFFADRLGGLDRREIRERVIERFSAARMADRYEELYARMIAAAGGVSGARERVPDAAEVEEALAVQLPSQVTEPADAELPDERNGATPPETAMDGVEVVATPRRVEVAAGRQEGTAQPRGDRAEAAAEHGDATTVSDESTIERGDGATSRVDSWMERDEPAMEPGDGAVWRGGAATVRADATQPAEPAPERERVAPAPVEIVIESDDGEEPVSVPVEAAVVLDAAVVDASQADSDGPDSDEPAAAPAPAPEPAPEAATEATAFDSEPKPASDRVAENAADGRERPESAAEEAASDAEPAAPQDAVASADDAREATEATPEMDLGTERAALEPESASETAAPATGAASSDTEPAIAPRPPIAVGPGPAPVEPTPAVPPATETQPAPPVAKRPTRSISIFSRTWSGSSGKKAAGARRRERS